MKPPGVDWSASEAASVNDFLNTPVGRKWLGVLLTRKPKIDIQSSIEKAAMTGAFIAGYESFFVEISNTRVAIREPENASIKAIDTKRD
jgi:hypothetical protein